MAEIARSYDAGGAAAARAKRAPRRTHPLALTLTIFNLDACVRAAVLDAANP